MKKLLLFLCLFFLSYAGLAPAQQGGGGGGSGFGFLPESQSTSNSTSTIGGSTKQPSLPTDSESMGETISATYNSCSHQETLNSINEFRTMVNKIENNDKCNAIKDNLKNNIPSQKDIEAILDARSKLSVLRKSEKDLRDIVNNINRLQEEHKNNPQENQQQSMMKQAQIMELANERAKTETKISNLQRKLGRDKGTQSAKAYRAIIRNIESYSTTMADAYDANCFSKNNGTNVQAALSLTSLVGMLMTASPLGAGVATGARLIGKIVKTGSRFNMEDLDKAQLDEGLRCAMKTMRQQHCELIKNQTLLMAVDTTEADSCIDCKQTPSPDITNIEGLLKALPSANNNGEADEQPTPEKFLDNFADNNHGQTLNNLAQYVSFFEGDSDFQDYITPIKESEGGDLRTERTAIVPTEELMGDIKKAKELWDGKDIDDDEQAQKEFQDLIQKINNLEGNKITKFTTYIEVYNGYNQKKVADFCANYAKDCSEIKVREMNKNVALNLFSLSDKEGILNKSIEFQKAVKMDKKKLEAFAGGLQTEVEKAIVNEERKDVKQDMCRGVLGMTDKIAHNKTIQASCKEVFKFEGMELPFEKFIQLPHEDRVCAVKDFFSMC